jgi:hypothetical protein
MSNFQSSFRQTLIRNPGLVIWQVLFTVYSWLPYLAGLDILNMSSSNLGAILLNFCLAVSDFFIQRNAVMNWQFTNDPSLQSLENPWTKSISSRILQSEPKDIWGALDKFSFSAAGLKASFRPARSNTVSGAPSLFPVHRERSGHAGHNGKRDGLPPVGDHFHNSWFVPFISRRAFPPAPPIPPPPLDLPAVSTADFL